MSEVHYRHYVCIECGEVFFSTDPPVTLYCSPECENKAHREHTYLSTECRVPNPWNLEGLQAQVCEKCGEVFIVRDAMQKSICQRCMSQKINVTDQRRVCKVCGKEFMGRGNKVTCSPECTYANKLDINRKYKKRYYAAKKEGKI